jgi:hypothetical protein
MAFVSLSSGVCPSPFYFPSTVLFGIENLPVDTTGFYTGRHYSLYSGHKAVPFGGQGGFTGTRSLYCKGHFRAHVVQHAL